MERNPDFIKNAPILDGLECKLFDSNSRQRSDIISCLHWNCKLLIWPNEPRFVTTGACKWFLFSNCHLLTIAGNRLFYFTNWISNQSPVVSVYLRVPKPLTCSPNVCSLVMRISLMGRHSMLINWYQGFWLSQVFSINLHSGFSVVQLNCSLKFSRWSTLSDPVALETSGFCWSPPCLKIVLICRYIYQSPVIHILVN